MTNSFAPINAQAAYLPIELDFPADEKMFREILSKRERLTASIVNVKEIGQYELNEIINAQQWFSTQPVGSPRKTRYTFRKVFDIVALNNGTPLAVATTYSFAHNISGLTIPTRIFGTATTSTGKYIPLPYVSTLQTDDIQIYLDGTNVVLKTGTTIDGGANTLTQAYIVAEYLKQ